MQGTNRPVSRRTMLRTTGVTGLAVAGLSTTFGAAGAADRDCCVCWVDVKPDSCPNSINPNSNGVISVTAGPPEFDPETVRLVPITESCAEDAGFDPAFDDCQDYRDPEYMADCRTLRALHECEADGDDRAASPVRWSSEDVDSDGDDDTVFKFSVGELDLRLEDAYLLLVGDTKHNDCRTYGIDSVRVVQGGGSRGRGSKR